MRVKEESYMTPKAPEKPIAGHERKKEPAQQTGSGSLLNMLLKILGIYFIKDGLLALSQTVSALIYLSQYATRGEALYSLGMTALPMLIYTVCSWLLIFKTEWIMRVLKLDRQEEVLFSFRLHRSVVLSIVIILMGGFLLVYETPELFRQGYYYVQERKLYQRMARPDISYFLMAAFRVAIGLALIIFNRSLVNLIEVRRKRSSPWYWPFNKLGKKKGKYSA